MQRYKCPDCGREWPDNYCPECARTIDRTLLPHSPIRAKRAGATGNERVVQPDPAPPREDRPPGLSKGRRVRLWLAAWAVALVATQVPLPFVLWAPATFLLFPTGLFRCLLPSSFTADDYNLAAALGWPIYAAVSLALLTQPRPKRYFVVYGVLCVLLITNVVGCQLEAHRPWKR